VFLLIQTELRGRALPYAALAVASLVVSLFVSLHLVIFMVFLLQMRLNQLLNYREKMNGLLGFYFLLPVSRGSIVYAKILAVGIATATAIGLGCVGHAVSTALSVELYSEGYGVDLLRALATLSAAASTVVIANMQRYLLILGVEQMVVRTRITALVLLVLVFLLFGQRLFPQISFESLIAAISGIGPLLWILGLAYAALWSVVTARQLSTKDTDHV
jgi:ABC-type Na+ efflux pump permease subunit